MIIKQSKLLMRVYYLQKAILLKSAKIVGRLAPNITLKIIPSKISSQYHMFSTGGG